MKNKNLTPAGDIPDFMLDKFRGVRRVRPNASYRAIKKEYGWLVDFGNQDIRFFTDEEFNKKFEFEQ